MKGKFEIMKEWRRDNQALFYTFVAIAAVAIISLIIIF